jgi:hypothetical protein
VIWVVRSNVTSTTRRSHSLRRWNVAADLGDAKRFGGAVAVDPATALRGQQAQIAAPGLIQRGYAADAPLEILSRPRVTLKHTCLD